MKKNRGIFILGMSLLVFSFSAYPVLAAQQEQGMQQQQGMQQTSAQKGAPIFIGPAAVMQIQQKLSQEGQHDLKADGVWGPSTAKAVKSFQQSKGLAPTGNLNIDTVQALGLSDVFSGNQAQPGASGQHQKFAKTQGARLYIGPSDLRQIQEKLIQEGQPNIKADGMWGPNTRQAIQKYQQDNGLKPTGDADLALIEHLGLSQMVAALSGKGSSQNVAMGQGQQEQMGQTGQARQNEAQGYYGQNQGAQSSSMGQKRAQKHVIGQGTPLYAGPETISRIQKALADSGRTPGQVNGEWNQSTQQALKAYQKDQNLEPTGSLTISTVQKLLGGFDLQGMGTEPSGSGMRSPGSTGNEPSGNGIKSPGLQQNQ